MEQHKGFTIRKSGKLYKVMDGKEPKFFHRFVSVEACKCAINSSIEKRPYTPEEHAIVYPWAVRS